MNNREKIMCKMAGASDATLLDHIAFHNELSDNTIQNTGTKAILNRGMNNAPKDIKKFLKDKIVEYGLWPDPYRSVSNSTLSIAPSDNTKGGGWLHIQPTEDARGTYSNITNLYVDPESRKQGYARALLLLAAKMYGDRPTYLRAEAYEYDPDGNIVDPKDNVKKRNKQLYKMYSGLGFKRDKTNRDLGNADLYPYEDIPLNPNDWTFDDFMYAKRINDMAPLYRMDKTASTESEIKNAIKHIRDNESIGSKRNWLSYGQLLGGTALGALLGGVIGSMRDSPAIQYTGLGTVVGGAGSAGLIAALMLAGHLRGHRDYNDFHETHLDGPSPKSPTIGFGDIINPYTNEYNAAYNAELSSKKPIGVALLNGLEEARWRGHYNNISDKKLDPLYQRAMTEVLKENDMDTNTAANIGKELDNFSKI